jgi:hypothetical protein
MDRLYAAASSHEFCALRNIFFRALDNPKEKAAPDGAASLS